MATDKKKPEIDEKHLMRMMAGNTPGNEELQSEAGTNTEDPPIIKKERSRKNKDTEKYLALFFKNVETAARDGKPVYISPEYHERLSRIVQVIGGGKLTIYAYLHNVLQHHFDEFADQIIVSFEDRYKPIL